MRRVNDTKSNILENATFELKEQLLNVEIFFNAYNSR